jgi:hypothetical protein
LGDQARDMGLLHRTDNISRALRADGAIHPGTQRTHHRVVSRHGLDPAQVQRETDPAPLMEGLYIKAEAGGVVTGRYKYVRAGFLQTVLDSASHWQDRPLLPNRLQAGVVVF